MHAYPGLHFIYSSIHCVWRISYDNLQFMDMAMFDPQTIWTYMYQSMFRPSNY